MTQKLYGLYDEIGGKLGAKLGIFLKLHSAAPPYPRRAPPHSLVNKLIFNAKFHKSSFSSSIITLFTLTEDWKPRESEGEQWTRREMK